MNYAGLKVLVGRMKAGDLLKILSLAEKYGTGEVRIIPGQALIVTNISDRKIGELAEEPLLKQFAYNPSALYRGLVSCVGNDYCNLAVIETKSRAVEVAKALEGRLGGTLKPITMHWSGCPASCGNHLVADVGLLGKKTKIDGKVVEAVDIFVGGRSGPIRSWPSRAWRTCLREAPGRAGRTVALSHQGQDAPLPGRRSQESIGRKGVGCAEHCVARLDRSLCEEDLEPTPGLGYSQTTSGAR